MATYIPTSSSYSSGLVTIDSSSGTLYEQIQASMGAFLYQIKNIYIKSNNNSQILEPIILQRYDVNGNITDNPVIPSVDPYQQQTALDIKIDSDNYVLDGKLNIKYDILANEDVYLYFDVIELDKSGKIKGGEDFDFLNLNDFFANFKNTINLADDSTEGISKSTDEEECCC